MATRKRSGLYANIHKAQQRAKRGGFQKDGEKKKVNLRPSQRDYR